ncbi:MAG: adenylyl-sulfate kinase [Terrimicrobiaceae bacterium]|nr:adenylyl-sulfate kinase [Terrimicrobiaceae bacterium]
MPENIHTQFHRFLPSAAKERLLGQHGVVAWLAGLSGSGKSTIAAAAERMLHSEGRFTVILDGDNLRSGLNSNLGFTDDDRRENVRRTAEVAKLFAGQGVITLVSLITPREEFRAMAREIVGSGCIEVYVKAPVELCAARDPKGLYRKAAEGGLANFTGRDSGFEEPERANLVLDTAASSVEECAARLVAILRERYAA